jgi:hypothetical protein
MNNTDDTENKRYLIFIVSKKVRLSKIEILPIVNSCKENKTMKISKKELI